MKKILAFVLSVCIILTFGACGGKKAENPEKAAEDAVVALFAALKSGDVELANEYLDIKGLAEGTGMEEETDTLTQKVLEALECKVISSEKVDEKAVKVKSEIKAMDVADVVGTISMKVLQETIMGDLSEEDFGKRTTELFVEMLEKGEVKTVTKTVDLTVEKGEGSWKVVPDEAFQNAVYGGFLDAVKNAQQGIGK